MIPLFLDKDAPIALHGLADPESNYDIKNPIVYDSIPAITLNNPADTRESTYDIESINIMPAYDETVEPNADRDGSLAGEPREVQKVIIIKGFVRGTTLAQLNDKIISLNRAFNPVLSWSGDADPDRGFLPLKFAVPTTDTANWPLGYILQQYFARSLRMPVPLSTKFDDLNARFTITLRAIDPRRYEQTTQSNNRVGSGNVAVANTLATYPSWPTLTLAFTTIPATDITIARSENQVGSIILNKDELADSAGKTLTINYQLRTAEYTTGLNKASALRSISRFQDVLAAASNTWVFTNLPADCTATITWRRAFA